MRQSDNDNSNNSNNSDHHLTLPYRRGVGIMLLNDDGRVFVGKRIDGDGDDAWQMPQGGMDEGESPADCAKRELEEETGISTVEVLAESASWYKYDLPPQLIGKIWQGKYRGQKQKWFAMRFKGDESEININGATAEFCAWKWEDAAQLPRIIVPFKRELYRSVLAEFADFVAL